MDFRHLYSMLPDVVHAEVQVRTALCMQSAHQEKKENLLLRFLQRYILHEVAAASVGTDTVKSGSAICLLCRAVLLFFQNKLLFGKNPQVTGDHRSQQCAQ